MRRHPVDEEAVTRALDTVRDGLDREIRHRRLRSTFRAGDRPGLDQEGRTA